jgi:hypothetical protein
MALCIFKICDVQNSDLILLLIKTQLYISSILCYKTLMYIREYITTNRKTKTKYVTHRLVEPFQTPNGPRQRVILHLGTLEIPKNKWRTLAALLEARLAGQSSLLDKDCLEFVTIAVQALEEDCSDQIKIIRDWGRVLGKLG